MPPGGDRKRRVLAPAESRTLLAPPAGKLAPGPPPKRKEAPDCSSPAHPPAHSKATPLRTRPHTEQGSFRKPLPFRGNRKSRAQPGTTTGRKTSREVPHSRCACRSPAARKDLLHTPQRREARSNGSKQIVLPAQTRKSPQTFAPPKQKAPESTATAADSPAPRRASTIAGGKREIVARQNRSSPIRSSAEREFLLSTVRRRPARTRYEIECRARKPCRAKETEPEPQARWQAIRRRPQAMRRSPPC